MATMKNDSAPKHRKYVALCYYDRLPCDRFIDDLGFSSCYVKDSDGKLSFVCPRFVAKGHVYEDLVPEKLIPK